MAAAMLLNAKYTHLPNLRLLHVTPTLGMAQVTRVEEQDDVQLSLFHGPTDSPLLQSTLADFLDQQCETFGNNEAIVTPWTGTRWTYKDLQRHSKHLSRYLLARGIQPGARIGILAGNRVEYASVFFACMRIGAILVVLNNTYTTQETRDALNYTKCRILFTTTHIGRTDNTTMLADFCSVKAKLPALQQIVLLAGSFGNLLNYEQAVHIAARLSAEEVIRTQSQRTCYETCNLQFTSGSTGVPKTAMLSHRGLLNNARFIGDRMNLGPTDILCCPPPLFHCFGLVLGLLACLTHGAKVVYPSETFDGASVLAAITAERCTALHGVPAMFDTLFSLPKPVDFDCSSLRTGIIAGAPVPRHLMELLVEVFGMTEFTSSYGLTEASPTCFNAFVDDTIDRRLTSVGTVMPHASAKVIDQNGNIVPVGIRGELCMSGYQIQQGYWQNSEESARALKQDADGRTWLHTGDEAFIDEHGYCTITGRFKDIIIRGGENIYPLEIEERLVEHAAIERAIVVGVPDVKYGEQIAVFVQRIQSAQRPSLQALQEWTRMTLGRHKAPMHVFWLGEGHVPNEIPVTGSGKIKKYEMRSLAQSLLARRSKM